MSKQVRPNELAEVVTGLLVRPDLLGELDGSSQKHEDFIEAIGRVVADFCGGDINCVHPADLPLDHTPDFVETAYLSVWPDSSLPSLEGCVWAPYDPDGWEGYTNAEFGLTDGTPQSEADVNHIRGRLQGLLIEAINAQQVPSASEQAQAKAAGMNPTQKHSIKSFAEASAYITALAATNLMFHFDDDPEDCLSAHNLTADQINAINHNVDQLFCIDWSKHGYDCVFDYAIAKSRGTSEPAQLKASDANGQTVEIDNPVELLVQVNDIPAGAQLIIRDIGLAGREQDHVELICEDTHDGTSLTVDPSDVSIKYA
ncbi:hypothetical protein [Marinobacter sp.]|uniref:hypothetical protein n=1 Tax=Marinobacter sp. TaxID=50741 RepID=UPI0026162DE0|nr:hypothetical protein [Marinobacter sp.]